MVERSHQGPGKGPLGGPRASQDQQQVDEKGIKSDLAVLLRSLEDMEKRVVKSGQQVFFGTAQLGHRIETLQRTHQGGTHDVRIMYDALFDAGVPAAALEDFGRNVAKRGVPDNQLFSTGYIKEKFFSKGVISEAGLKFNPGEGGEAWLSKHVQEELEGLRGFDLGAACKVQDLARSMGTQYGNSAAMMTRLMFVCSGNEPGAEERSVRFSDPAEKIGLLVRSRLAEARTKGVREENTFVEGMQMFLGVYADITAKVLQNAKPEQQANIHERSKAMLSKLLQSEQLRAAHLDPGKSPPDPFSIFSELLREEGAINPWVVGDSTETPFDIGKFHLLISPDVPRGLVADAVFVLNNYQEALLAQDVAKIPASVQKYKDRQRQAGANAELPSGLDITKALTNAASRICRLRGEKFNAPNPKEDTEEVLRLKRQEYERIVEDFVRPLGRGIPPFSALLRIVDPKKVVRDGQIRDDFIPLLKSIPKFSDTAEDADKVRIVASSVKTFLEDPDPYLDVPLLGTEGDYSLRTLLTIRANEWFDKEILLRGPYAHSDRKGAPPPEPLIPPRDTWRVPKERLVELAKNFNTAAGAKWLWAREWIEDACKILRRLPNSYENILGFASRESKRYYKMPGEYEVVFYASATDAMSNIVDKLFPNMVAGDYFIGSPQEYESMADPLIHKGARFEAAYINERIGDTRRTKTPDQFYDDIVRIIESPRKDGRLPRAIFLSSKTRFGDAVGVTPPEPRRVLDENGKETGEEKMFYTPNTHGLSMIIQRLKSRYPSVPVAVDGCQSVGRNDRDEDLSRLGCDIFINSGGKGPGIENVSMVAIRKVSLEQRDDKGNVVRKDGKPVFTTPEHHWLEHITDEKVLRNPESVLTPGKGTVDISRVAALGFALQLLDSRIDTWSVIDPSDKRKQRDRIADHMGAMTEHMLTRTQEYAGSLFKRLQTANLPFPIPDEASLAKNPEFVKRFGCQVVHPAHQNIIDYDGIVTLTFPNIGTVERKNVVLNEGTPEQRELRIPYRDNYLKTALDREGWPSEQCKKGGNAWRFSVHASTFPTNEHIDNLVEKIADVHIEFLKLQIEKGNRLADKAGDENLRITSWESLLERTENVQDYEWLED
ncbi:hypothetical protein HY971_03785 [Candidatus Kaiserbacteria bacterium]|nr:hypothetical protein [Candidatus Kaiserbacteria bacterium]